MAARPHPICTARAAIPVLASWFMARLRWRRWVLVIIAGGGLIAAIAASRLLLGVHSLAEIGLGLVIGLVSVALFGRVYRRVSHRPVWPLLIAAGVLAAMLHGRELRAEEFLAR